MSRTLLKYRGPKGGQAFIRTKRLNGGREVYLGKFGTPESWRDYHRHLARLHVDARSAASVNDMTVELTPIASDECRLVVELIAAFLDQVIKRMTQDGAVRKEYRKILRAMANLDQWCGDLPGNDVDPSHLEVIQEKLAAVQLPGKLINKRVTFVKRFFACCSKNHT